MFLGRAKEILITAGGENIAPIPIENNIKSELPDIVSNVIGKDWNDTFASSFCSDKIFFVLDKTEIVQDKNFV